MKKVSGKYTIYGRKKGRKKIHSVDKDFFVNYKINLEKDIRKNKKNIIDVGSGKGENTFVIPICLPPKESSEQEIFLLEDNISIRGIS